MKGAISVPITATIPKIPIQFLRRDAPATKESLALDMIFPITGSVLAMTVLVTLEASKSFVDEISPATFKYPVKRIVPPVRIHLQPFFSNEASVDNKRC